MAMTTAWLVLAVGDARQHGGNDGYDDNPSEHYSWDSTVPNSGQIAAGDVIAVWNKQELIGVSVIEDIETGQAEKARYSCPQCSRADFKRRTRLTPAWRCSQCGALFDEPVQRIEPVTTYRSLHAAQWKDGRGTLTGRQLRALCDSPNSQLSMRPARWEKLRAALEEASGPGWPAPGETGHGAWRPVRGGHRIVRTRTRNGQQDFRTQLLSEQGQNCALSGPAPAAVLDAAHLYGYAEAEEHFEHGGLLLRSDLHRLFDRGQIGIRPDTGLIDVDASLHGYPLYEQLHGRAPHARLRPEHRSWLAAHWHEHRS
ncbi:HNH endonuclease [Streptomyces decoyicus]|uniref:HNH endonuclease signature motif containing protein n=1 Tax=Streptomyces decoyicus TaxID=249567 RepID=UPI002E31934B|nr:HNH endonuclease signature motif containing protein [Streptomyces decoyicus]